MEKLAAVEIINGEKTMTVELLKKLKTIEAIKQEIAKDRDELMVMYNELDTLIESLNTGIESIEDGKREIENGIAELSQSI